MSCLQCKTFEDQCLIILHVGRMLGPIVDYLPAGITIKRVVSTPGGIRGQIRIPLQQICLLAFLRQVLEDLEGFAQILG